MKTALTPTEQMITAMVHSIDALTEQMNALMPVTVDNPEFDKWKQLYSCREDLHIDLYKVVESYIREMAKVEERWENIANDNYNCTQALETIQRLHNGGIVPDDEYHQVSKPIIRKLQDMQDYAISSVLKKESEYLNLGLQIP